MFPDMYIRTQKDATTSIKPHLALYREAPYFLTHKVGTGLAIPPHVPSLPHTQGSVMFLPALPNMNGSKHIGLPVITISGNILGKLLSTRTPSPTWTAARSVQKKLTRGVGGIWPPQAHDVLA